ncbi:MAG: hypothetical protein HRU15_07625, partial [Planctomycetes bacterium]|nr:hypothetical protein [Planctomycetota bacterium]
MRSILISLLLCAIYLHAHAADLFGNEQVNEGEMAYADQKDLYDQFFGDMDSAASNASKKLKFALSLKTASDDTKYAAMRRYILRRIESLCEGSKKKEAYELQVFVFNEFYKSEDPNRADNEDLIALLEKLLGKTGKDEQEAIVQEICTLCNQNAQMSLNEKEYSQAGSDYKVVAGWLAKANDKDGAKLAKDMVKHISNYVKEKKKIDALQIKADADAADTKSNAAVARFYLSEGAWSSALPYLNNAQESSLEIIATHASKEDASNNDKSSCIAAISKALRDKANKKDIGVRRAILQLGCAYRSDLNRDNTGLSEADKIKFALMSENFAADLESIGPNPLAGFEVASSGSSVDEARLIRMGWVAIFDHEKPCIKRDREKDSDIIKTEVKNGVFITRMKKGARTYLDIFPNASDYKAIKIRFKFLHASQGWLHITATPKGDSLKLMNRFGSFGFTAGFGHEYGAIQSIPDDWNDATLSWDGKEMTATFNGQEYDKKAVFPHESIKYIQFM